MRLWAGGSVFFWALFGSVPLCQTPLVSNSLICFGRFVSVSQIVLSDCTGLRLLLKFSSVAHLPVSFERCAPVSCSLPAAVLLLKFSSVLIFQ